MKILIPENLTSEKKVNTPKKLTFPAMDRWVQESDVLQASPQNDEYFLAAVRENALFHQRNNSVVAHLYERHQFNPEQLLTIKDLEKLPSIGVAAMKFHLLLTLPETQATLVLTSSGTRGQKTQIWFDADSLERCQNLLRSLWRAEKLIDSRKTHYLCFVYDPAQANNLGIAFSEENQQQFAPKDQVYYAIQKDDEGQWQANNQTAYAQLIHWIKTGQPIRVTGIPAFVYDFILYLRANKQKCQLPEGSWVFIGGGWKAAEDKKVTRQQFRADVSEVLGISQNQIRDNYGMAEHCAPYIECAHHRFHIPNTSRVLVRDPITFQVLPAGVPGLLELISPWNAMMPSLSVLSTDFGQLSTTKCECGSTQPTLEILGRAGNAKHKGCALTAEEIVARGSHA